jgi:hypothetical protein
MEPQDGAEAAMRAEQLGRCLGIAIETRATAIYTDIGTVDDQPRSVAICPNRKCVAFGCRMGIELHWVDAVTGGDLSRWFPLAAPSDFLYFLPPRAGIDSRKKLRLISSAAGPVAPQLIRSDSTPAKWKYWPTPAAYGRRKSLTRLFFGRLPFPSPAGSLENAPDSERTPGGDEVQGVLRTVDCDHFHAVPVSDGYHLVFTDPASGLLCLGSDAPLGGPTKLIRKIVFIPPDYEAARKPAPLRYAVGKILDWGLRVVAAYDNGQIVLFSVPSDVFKSFRDRSGKTDAWDENAGVLGQSDLIMDSLMVNVGGEGADTAASEDSRSITPLSSTSSPLQLPGSLITRADGRVVDDLAVNAANGGLSVWIFFRTGCAELHSVFNPGGEKTRQSYVGDNGFVYPVNVEEQAEVNVKGKQKATDERHVKWAGQEDVN